MASRATPGPWSVTFHAQRAVGHGRADPDLRFGRRVLGGVLDQVRQHLVHLRVVEVHRWQLVGQVQRQRVRRDQRPQPRGHLVDQGGRLVPAAIRLERAALQARQVQQVAHDAVEPMRLLLDGLGEAAPRLVVPLHVALAQAAGRGQDRGQRRAQVVAHRVEQRRLHLVGAAQHLGFIGLVAQPRPIHRSPQLRRHGLQQAHLGRPEVAVAPGGQDHLAGLAVRRAHRYPQQPQGGNRWRGGSRPAGMGLHDAHPSAAARAQHLRPPPARAARQRLQVGAGSRRCAGQQPAVLAVDHDPHRQHAQLAAQPLCHAARAPDPGSARSSAAPPRTAGAPRARWPPPPRRAAPVRRRPVR